ncbi:MAG: PIN domain-containing protein [Myxococcaceae bacterium]|nr:PIN domain-containing protein [Myxococcaceae bacterium]
MVVKFLLDTNTCIFLGRRTYPQLAHELRARSPEDFGISAVTVAELVYGRASGASTKAVDLVMSNLRVLPFDEAAAHATGEVRANLERRNLLIGPYDLQIAGHALSLGFTLVTNNLREFSRVRGLKVVDWTA